MRHGSEVVMLRFGQVSVMDSTCDVHGEHQRVARIIHFEVLVIIVRCRLGSSWSSGSSGCSGCWMVFGVMSSFSSFMLFVLFGFASLVSSMLFFFDLMVSLGGWCRCSRCSSWSSGCWCSWSRFCGCGCSRSSCRGCMLSLMGFALLGFMGLVSLMLFSFHSFMCLVLFSLELSMSLGRGCWWSSRLVSRWGSRCCRLVSRWRSSRLFSWWSSRFGSWFGLLVALRDVISVVPLCTSLSLLISLKLLALSMNQLFLLLTEVFTFRLVTRKAIVCLVVVMSRSGRLEVFEQVLPLMHFELTAIFSSMSAFARLVMLQRRFMMHLHILWFNSFPLFFCSMPVVFGEALEVHPSEPRNEVESVVLLLYTMQIVVSLLAIMIIVVLLVVIKSILMELKLILIIKRVALRLFLIQHPIVRDNRRVCWEAPVHICLMSSIATFTTIVFMSFLIIFVIVKILEYWEGGLCVILFMTGILWAFPMVVMVVSHSWLMIEDMTFFGLVMALG